MKSTMKLCMCCLFLLVAVVVTAPATGRRGNVLSFLNDALGTTTEKTTTSTAARPPPNNSVNEHDSEDLSEENSQEIFDTNGFTGVTEGPDSDEVVISEVSDKSPSKRRVENTTTAQTDSNRRLVQEQWSGGPHQAQQIDLSSGEAVTAGAGDTHSSGEHVIDGASAVADHRRKATTEGDAGFHGMLAAGRSRELQDLDSLEDNRPTGARRPVPVGNRRDPDYDKTREFLSSETYPLAPPEHMSVPAKSRGS